MVDSVGWTPLMTVCLHGGQCGVYPTDNCLSAWWTDSVGCTPLMTVCVAAYLDEAVETLELEADKHSLQGSRP